MATVTLMYLSASMSVADGTVTLMLYLSASMSVGDGVSYLDVVLVGQYERGQDVSVADGDAARVEEPQHGWEHGGHRGLLLQPHLRLPAVAEVGGGQHHLPEGRGER